MKYANSLKYMNSFAPAQVGADISNKRISELCAILGRINVGTRYIVIPSGSAGHVCAKMLESVIRSAGYCVGRISSEADYDSRGSVFINGEMPSIEDYNKCVAELKNAEKKTPDSIYLREEMTFVLSLLMCKLEGCEYVILEGLFDSDYSLDAVCAPYDLIVIPTFCENELYADIVKACCEAIRRGVREVVSGNQKNSVYGMISNACVLGGVRLDLTAKPTFAATEVSGRKLVFSYSGRDGYVVKSPSHLVRECAMLTIESALAIRRDGVKMPWSSIMAGLERAADMVSFDMISVSPAVIVDGAGNSEETEQLIETYHEIIGAMDGLVVCVRAESREHLDDMLGSFVGKAIEEIIVIWRKDAFDLSGLPCLSVVECSDTSDAAELVHSAAKQDKCVLCFGDVPFAKEIKTEFIKLMGY